LKEKIKEGQFREDLYFRLAVVVISLPPLRERGEDTAVLAQEFLQRYAAQNGKKNLSFTPEALRAINCHRWTGNVRELQNRVKRGVIMADSRRITPQDLELTSEAMPATTLREAREQVEREMVQQALKKHLGRISSAAAELGISRPTLYELMEKLGISREQ
jgi:two-component system NtrC family response regulator